jgi:DNA-binding transcriptional regulator YdaS (Cro superfamily)
MELKKLIERAEKAAGSQKALGLILGINPSNLRNAKAGQQGLPVAASYQLKKNRNGELSCSLLSAAQ